jgi:hypothetical protein
MVGLIRVADRPVTRPVANLPKTVKRKIRVSSGLEPKPLYVRYCCRHLIDANCSCTKQYTKFHHVELGSDDNLKGERMAIILYERWIAQWSVGDTPISLPLHGTTFLDQVNRKGCFDSFNDDYYRDIETVESLCDSASELLNGLHRNFIFHIDCLHRPPTVQYTRACT